MSFRTWGIERNVNCLIAVGIVSSAEVYAPTATNATWPKDRIPELPLNICSASTISRRRKNFSTSVAVEDVADARR